MTTINEKLGLQLQQEKLQTSVSANHDVMLAARDASTRSKIQKMVVDLAIQSVALTKKDILKWRQAWQIALSWDNPRRNFLYDIYDDIMIDLHLTGAIGQRKDKVLQKVFKLVNKSTNEEDENVTKLFKTSWFREFVSLALDSRYYGHSLIQVGDPYIDEEGVMRFNGVELIPRRHVIPEYGLILKSTSDDLKSGIRYEEKYKDWCIAVGNKKDLGLLLGVAKHCISKKNVEAFWDGFAELFGMPIRIGKTSSRDPKDRSDIEGMLENMGAAAWALFPESTEIEIKETTRGDAFKVYDARIDRANSEISKGVMRQTMTIDNGSSRSQGEVHMDVFDQVVESDAIMITDVVNDNLIPLMVRHGFNVKGFSFEYEDIQEYSAQEQVNIETMILNNFDVEANYFEEKYGVKIIGQKAPPAPAGEKPGTPPAGGDKGKVKNFFD